MPQYTVHMTIASFKEGSSVKRAFTGPVGTFTFATQMKFDVSFATPGGPTTDEQITATMRGESESTNVADHVAKTVAKHYAKLLAKTNAPAPAIAQIHPGF